MNLQVSSRGPTEDLLTGPNLRLRIGEHIVDTGALRVLTRPELPRLTNKAVAVLIELVRHVGQTVTRDQLLDRVWTGRFPTPDVLTQAIKELRRAFADDSKPPQYIETIPKIGYRLIASVLMLGDPEGGIVVETAMPRPLFVGDQDDETANGANAERAIVPIAEKKPARMAWLLGAAAAGAVLATLAILVLRDHVGSSAAAPLTPTWKVSDAHALTSDPGAERRPDLAPDGTRVAFAAADAGSTLNRIVARSIDPSQLVRISAGGTQQETLPVWSPDGTRIAFERARENGCTLFVASSLGGDEREVGGCRDSNVTYYNWTPDGGSLITAQSRTGSGGDLALVTLDLDSGAEKFLKYARTPADQDLEPHYSPDGRSIAFRRGVAPYSDLHVMPASGGDVRQITHIASRIRGHAWSRDGSALIFASNFAGAMSLYAVDVASGAVQPLGVSPAEYPSTARDADAIVYEIPRTQSQLALIDLGDANAPARTLASSTGSDYAAALSPTADRLAFISDRSGQFQLWLLDRSTDVVTPLTDKADTPVFWPRWSADGKRIVAVALASGSGRQLIEIDVASRRQRVLSKPDESILFGGYAVDDDSYLFAIGSSGRSSELVLVRHPRQPDESRQLIESGIAFAQVDAALHAVYYTTTAGGLYRYDLDNGDKRFISSKVSSVTTNGWRVVDGRIWYLTGFEVKPIVLHELDPASGEEHVLSRMDISVKDVNFSVMPDRKSLVLSEIGTEDTDIGMFMLTRAGTR
jgi:Tol biopolymer transport system component/DNA-binding winged helix-turn-helix (wHTH) protein